MRTTVAVPLTRPRVSVPPLPDLDSRRNTVPTASPLRRTPTTLATFVYAGGSASYIDDVVSMRRDLVGPGLAALPVGGGGGSQSTADVYFHADDLFSVTSVTDSSGGVVERADYGDYGERLLMDAAGSLVTTPDPATNRISSRVGNPWWFTGRELDQETGLYQYRYRFMNPKIGRFVSRDPIGTWGDSSLWGSSGNYTASKPVFFVDPFGLWEDRYDGLDRNAIPAGPPNPPTGGPSNGSSGSNGTISRRGA